MSAFAFEFVPAGTLEEAVDVLRSIMTDTCTIEREAIGPGIYDPDTYTTTVPLSTVYDGDCYLGDRVEGALTTGGFGANAAESAYDARTHNMLLRLPLDDDDALAVRVGDIVTMTGPHAALDRYRVNAREEGTHKVANTFRLVRFDPDQSRS